MKYFIFFIALTLGISLNAQESIEKNIGEFSTVKVYDLIHLKMIKSKENKVVVSGRNRNDVEVVNKNGQLKIRMNFQKIFDGNDTVVILYYNAVDVIDANEGSKVTVKDVLDQYEVDLRVQEGAEITAALKTTYSNFKAVTGGIINVTGSSNQQNITIYTGGFFNGKDFITKTSETSINAGGEAYIHTTESANVKIKAGGSVYIYGKPKQIEESTVLGGSIKRM